MKIETILSALEINCWDRHRTKEGYLQLQRGLRQYHTFRDRIIRMDKDKDEEIEYLVEYGGR